MTFWWTVLGAVGVQKAMENVNRRTGICVEDIEKVVCIFPYITSITPEGERGGGGGVGVGAAGGKPCYQILF